MYEYLREGVEGKTERENMNFDPYQIGKFTFSLT
jgi:hypothetical protein